MEALDERKEKPLQGGRKEKKLSRFVLSRIPRKTESSCLEKTYHKKGRKKVVYFFS